MGGHSVQVREDFILEMTFENNSEKGRVGSFPGGPVANSLASNAGDTGSIPGWGTKIPHSAEHLSPRTAILSPHSTTRVHGQPGKIPNDSTKT